MTEKNLNKGTQNRELRKKALCNYETVLDAIINFENEDFRMDMEFKSHEKDSWRTIFPNEIELMEMLKKMRDRYSKEIAELDKEFESL